MSFLFSTPKTKTQAVPPPPAIPEVDTNASDFAAKKARRRSGFEKTLITGDLTPMPTGKKRLLGG